MTGPSEESIRCNNCGTFNRARAKFCKSCGTQIRGELRIRTGPLGKSPFKAVECSGCRNRVVGAANYCPFCGKQLRVHAGSELYRGHSDDRLVLQIGKATDIGRKRRVNEDAISTIEFTISEEEAIMQLGLFVVCDGMGGANAGEVASQAAIRAVNTHVILALQKGGAGAFKKRAAAIVADALKAAHRIILDEAVRDPDKEGMGTTAVVALASGTEVYVNHVGDSRCYHLSGNKLRQLTADDSLLSALIRKGTINAENKNGFRGRNVITHALGINVDTEPPLQKRGQLIRLKVDDRLLLCTDGLTIHLRDGEIGSIIKKNNDPRQACRRLLDSALARGGRDNIGVILLKCVAAE